MAPERMPLMAGNWKMNLDHLQAAHLVQKLDWALKDGKHDFEKVEVAVFPPFTDLRTVQTLIEGDRLDIVLGAQDLSEHPEGAHTGDICGAFLKRLECTYVIVGHSERRQHHHEDDAVVRAKVAAALQFDLVPIVCVGEGLQVRQAGEHVPHVLAQVDAALEGLTEEQVASLVIAYEPVWAIGTGEVATPDDAQEVCGAIRQRIAQTHGEGAAGQTRVLYGGSVKPANVASLMAQPDIDGALVGGASLVSEDFAAIVRYLEHVGA